MKRDALTTHAKYGCLFGSAGYLSNPPLLLSVMSVPRCIGRRSLLAITWVPGGGVTVSLTDPLELSASVHDVKIAVVNARPDSWPFASTV